jgi:hypothetical protein
MQEQYEEEYRPPQKLEVVEVSQNLEVVEISQKLEVVEIYDQPDESYGQDDPNYYQEAAYEEEEVRSGAETGSQTDTQTDSRRTQRQNRDDDSAVGLGLRGSRTA